MTQGKQKRWSERTTTERIVISIAVMVAVVLGLGFVATMSNNSSTNLDSESTAISEKAAEEACQQVAVTKTQGRDISIIDTWNYNLTFTEDIGDGMSSIQWNGKDNKSDGRVLFVCDVAGTSGSLTVVSLTMSGERLQ